MNTLKLLYYTVLVSLRFNSLIIIRMIILWIFYSFFLFIQKNVWIKLFIDFSNWISESIIWFFSIQSSFFEKDIYAWIVIVAIEFWLFIYLLLYNRKIYNPLRYIWGDIIFSFIVLKNISLGYLKTRDKDRLKIDIYYYIKSWSWVKYLELNNIERKLIKINNLMLLSTYDMVSKYFNKKYKKEWIESQSQMNSHIIDIKEEWNNITVLLNIPVIFKEDEFFKINKNDLLRSIWFNPEKFSIETDVGNNIKLEITKKIIKKEIITFDSVKHFFKKGFYFLWLDDQNNTPIYIDRSNKSLNQSLGCYGIPWMGKSWFLTSLAMQVLKEDSQIWSSSVKSDLNFLNKFKNTIATADNIENSIAISESVLSEIKRRNNLFKWQDYIKDINDYNKSFPKNKIPQIYYIHDEISATFKEILETYWKEKLISYQNTLSRISTTSRSAWIVLIWSIVNPLAEIFWKWGSESRNTLNPISFNTRIKSSSVTVFWDGWSWAEKLSEGEIVFLDALTKWYKKVRTPLITSDDIKYFVDNNKDLQKSETEKPKNNITLFLEESKKQWKLSYKLSQNYNISRRSYDKISKELQEKKIVEKLKDNSLVFANTNENT